MADGTSINPYRVHVKSPCFTAMSIFHVLAKGMYIADIIALIGSLDVVLGGGNAKQMTELPTGVELGHNRNAFLGGARLWVSTPSATSPSERGSAAGGW